MQAAIILGLRIALITSKNGKNRNPNSQRLFGRLAASSGGGGRGATNIPGKPRTVDATDPDGKLAETILSERGEAEQDGGIVSNPPDFTLP